MDKLKLEPLVQPAKQYNLAVDKIKIAAVIPTPHYPNDSKNVKLRKQHLKITGGG
jgi:hypothetical protein